MPIDLTNWKLTLPVDSAGKFSGDAREIKDLKSFSHPEYFKRNSDGSLTFTAPTVGATTSGSHYPRCELREMNKGKLAAWKPAQNRRLKAFVSVNELPVTKEGKQGRVVIGQIHGKKHELCRLYYDNGKIYYYNDKAGKKKKETKFDLKNRLIALNEPFAYSIDVINGVLQVIVSCEGEAFVSREPIGSYWKDDALYFKAGVYCQVGRVGGEANTQGTGRATATFYRIEME